MSRPNCHYVHICTPHKIAAKKANSLLYIYILLIKSIKSIKSSSPEQPPNVRSVCLHVVCLTVKIIERVCLEKLDLIDLMHFVHVTH
jgi:hypothetical protein